MKPSGGGQCHCQCCSGAVGSRSSNQQVSALFGCGVNSCLAAARASKAQFSSRHPTNSRQQTPTARRQRVGRRSWPCGEPLRGRHAGADGCFHARPTAAQQSASAGWASARGVSLAWPASSLHGPPPGNQHLSPLASQPLAA